MTLYMILAERDKIYPECLFITQNKNKAEKKFLELAKNSKIESFNGNKWFFDNIDVYVLTKKNIKLKDFK